MPIAARAAGRWVASGLVYGAGAASLAAFAVWAAPASCTGPALGPAFQVPADCGHESPGRRSPRR